MILKKDKVKKLRPLTAKDIEANCMRIQAALEKTKVGTKEFEILTEELTKQRELMKKYRDSVFFDIKPRDWLVVGGTTVAIVFFIALSREHPTALKVCTGIMKLMPFHGI